MNEIELQFKIKHISKAVGLSFEHFEKEGILLQSKVLSTQIETRR